MIYLIWRCPSCGKYQGKYLNLISYRQIGKKVFKCKYCNKSKKVIDKKGNRIEIKTYSNAKELEHMVKIKNGSRT